VELGLVREGMEAARGFGRELEQAGVPTKLELVRAFAGHVAKTIVEAAGTIGPG
jgi:hypothetical protein